MTAKAYLSQIRTVVIGIKSLTRQVQALEDTLTGASPGISDMPGSATPNVRRMEKLMAGTVQHILKNSLKYVFLQAEHISIGTTLPRMVVGVQVFFSILQAMNCCAKELQVIVVLLPLGIITRRPILIDGLIVQQQMEQMHSMGILLV